MKLLNKKEICKVFPMKEAVQAAKDAFRNSSDGKGETPLRTAIETDEGVLLFMPAYQRETGYASLKIYDNFTGNLAKGLPTSSSQVILMNAKTGEIVALMDGNCVTQIRTGAASGAAFDVLGRRDAVKGALIGTGGQGMRQLEAMLCVRNLKEVKVFDIVEQQKEAFVKAANERLSDYGTKITASASADEAVEDADLLITVTPSKRPVFDAAKCKPGLTVSCVGAFRPEMQEMDPKILPMASKIFCDSTDAVLEESGDLIKPLLEGVITKEDITGELGDVLANRKKGRESDDEIIVFETVGIGLQDLYAAKVIYKRAMAYGIGIEWN